MGRKMSGWSYGSKYAMPPKSELGPPMKKFEDTFSAVTALLQKFPPSQPQKGEKP